MLLILEEETYRPIFPLEQMLLMREFAAVHKIWGIRGIYFVVLYGWVGSPYIDEEESIRKKNVLAAMSNKSWYQADSLYQLKGSLSDDILANRVEITDAIAKLNAKYPIKEIVDSNYYNQRVNELRVSIKDIKIDPKRKSDPMAIKQAAEAEDKVNKNIKELRNYQNDAELQLASKYKQVKFLSLNDLIDAVK